MATIYDVAAAAGVSAKTVSRVLNGEGPVGARTRDAVETAMSHLGYVPSQAARRMRSAHSGLVGLISGAISGPPMGPPQGLPDLFIAQGIQRVIGESDTTLMIADSGGNPARVPALIRTFLEHRVDGLIYVADYHRRIDLPPVPAATPLVLANCFDGQGTPAVLPDDEGGQHALVTRLIAAGHRRIAYLALPETMVAHRLRLRGYLRALAEAGIAHDPALVIPGFAEGETPLAESFTRALDHFLAMPDRPSVICGGNDEAAMRLYGLLRTRGLRVPEDISVAGYDDYRVISETLFPPLTTVELAYGAMGEAAAHLLLALIAGQSPPQSTLQPTPVIVPGPVRWRSSVTDLRSDMT